jgi:phosphoribosyl-ATP pyrophosphohydrolase
MKVAMARAAIAAGARELDVVMNVSALLSGRPGAARADLGAVVDAARSSTSARVMVRAVLVSVRPAGPACHTGEESCFHVPVTGTVGGDAAPFAALPDLEAVIRARAADADPDSSYTASLIARGIDTMCKKVGEEATEVAIAAKGGEREQLVYESADLLYHLVVLWQSMDIRLAEVAEELASRRRGEG